MATSFFRYRFVLTGGGTGGHIMPLVAMSEALQEYPVDILYIGEKGGREEAVAKENKINFKGIYAGKWRRYYTFGAIFNNILGLLKLKIGLCQSFYYLMQFKPRAIFAKGGYVSLPVMIAGYLLRVPIIIHESDVVPGITNRFGAKLAKEIATGFPTSMYHFEKNNRVIYSGIPVENDFYDSKIRPEDYQFFHFNRRDPVLLITGGIQGSHRINGTIKKILPDLLKNWQIIQLAGEYDYEVLKEWREKLAKGKERYAVFASLGKERVSAMRLADVVISRASASTLAEISLVGRPVILIPLPSAAGDHQRKNAKIYEDQKAAIVIDEKKLTPDKLYETIENLRKSKTTREEMAKAIAQLARPEAGRLLAEELLKVARE